MTQVRAIEATVRQEAEAWSRHDVQALLKLYARDAILEDSQYPEPLRGESGVRKDAENTFKSFPDVRVTILRIISSGDTVAVEWRFEGTNTGPLIMPDGTTMPATNRHVTLQGAGFWRVDQQGRIQEEHRYSDTASFMQQIGIMQGA